MKGVKKERHPDIEKFCLNCGNKLERKRYGNRIEDYAQYKKREVCDKACSVAFAKKNRKPKSITEPTEPPLPRLGSLPAVGPDEELTAEEYLLKVMNDHTLPASRRDQAAKILITAKAKAPVATKSKKEERAAAAEGVAAGERFTSTPPPGKVVGRIGG